MGDIPWWGGGPPSLQKKSLCPLAVAFLWQIVTDGTGRHQRTVFVGNIPPTHAKAGIIRCSALPELPGLDGPYGWWVGGGDHPHQALPYFRWCRFFRSKFSFVAGGIFPCTSWGGWEGDRPTHPTSWVAGVPPPQSRTIHLKFLLWCRRLPRSPPEFMISTLHSLSFWGQRRTIFSRLMFLSCLSRNRRPPVMP